MKKLTPDQTSSVIDAIGGTSQVASICDVTPGAVSQWRKNRIPKGFLLFLRDRYPVAFEDLGQEDNSEPEGSEKDDA